ncbi:MAG TPA: PPK2 family polyphosphate kinase [Stellaceae bacterium]|nr:PPK2 family polyphosphate kinase [Stellaceae bacterium]
MFPKIDLGELERYRVRTDGGRVTLADIDPRDRKGLPLDKPEAKKATKADIAEIDRMQEILYAQAKHALLIVLQGMDASGKDGTVRDVLGRLNPMGAIATNFRKPTEAELAHDFLWRVHKAAPPRRMIGIFNRSHYEDVLVTRVHGLVPPERIEARYDAINAFEKMLADNDTTIVKFFLHISRKEQTRRLTARLDDPTKRWKFSHGDIAEHNRWDDYTAAYEIALARCSTATAPWFIVPADRKWYRDAVIARIVRRTLDALDLSYPSEAPGLDELQIA